MAMAVIWTGMVIISLLCGAVGGQMGEVAGAAVAGAQAAVELCLSMAGAMCLWTGVMEVMRQSGLTEVVRNLLRPVLGRLFPEVRDQPDIMDAVSANVSANLLGLGNAATPLGIQAAELMAKSCGRGASNAREASNALCRFVVCNTASIQLIPTTVAAVRAGAGCATPFDILPAVWLSSSAALAVGLTAAWVLERVWRDDR